jgi:hypothetical protein
MKNWCWIVLSLAIAVTTWLYVHRIFDPWAAYVRSQETIMIAEMGDLYSPWVAARELLLYGRNPYSADVTNEIQMAFYGHPITQAYGKPGATLVNEQRFAYPVYAVFFMAPTVRMDFARVRRWAAVGLALLTVVSVLICLDFLGWCPQWGARIATCLLVLSCPQVVQGLRLEQLGLVVAFLLTLGAWCVRQDRLILAGTVLAFSTIKPQMSLFPICFFLIWAIGGWSKRWRLVAAFSLTLVLLVAAGEFILPGWIGYFLAAAATYPKYLPTFTSLLRVALGDRAGEVIGGALLLSLLVLAWRNRKQSPHSPQFASVFCAFLIATILAFPLLTPFNQVMLILPTMLLLSDWNALPAFSRRVFIALIAWPWLTSCVLLIFTPNLRSRSQLPLLPSFLSLFYPLFLPLLLMARRVKVGSAVRVNQPAPQ